MTSDDFRRQADFVRAIPLEVVLTSWGALRDRQDTSRWHTQRGPLSVTGAKFFNWHDSRGGGGAIDLVMHLGGWDARQAIRWLWRRLGCHGAGVNPTAHKRVDADTPSSTGSTSNSRSASSPGRSAPLRGETDGNPTRRHRHQQLHLPAASFANLPRVRGYLTQQRGLSAAILASLIDSGKLYADGRGNAVFVMVAGKPNRPIGAELRGTGNYVWRGLAPGTSKNAGYFWVGNRGSKQIVLCESAIDAISCFQLHTQIHGAPLPADCICISTAGVRPDAPWLHPLLARGYNIYCGFDADEPGEMTSRQMNTRHPTIQRLRPPRHDWNETLTSPNP
ncbi:MAG: DUF3991 and TOPRIM domain-containing protein [Planctomycetes bacterium]|nr:DUF3991 and TOPRIM domain-containing protein [Planctomycetota bacterium]MBL7039782.1 DUF3991 and TOPRIM domain-containing protein [Pirellulaceae bacterium]